MHAFLLLSTKSAFWKMFSRFGSWVLCLVRCRQRRRWWWWRWNNIFLLENCTTIDYYFIIRKLFDCVPGPLIVIGGSTKCATCESMFWMSRHTQAAALLTSTGRAAQNIPNNGRRGNYSANGLLGSFRMNAIKTWQGMRLELWRWKFLPAHAIPADNSWAT